MQTESARDPGIDVAKGLGIAFVVAGHSGVSILGINVYAFHMPLFFFISGYLFRAKPVPRHLLEKARTLVLPLYIYTFVYALLYFVALKTSLYPGGKEPSWTHAVLFDPFLTSHSIPFINPLWFVGALFVSSVLFNIYLNLTGDFAWLGGLSGAALILAATQLPAGGDWRALAGRTMAACGWLCLGHCFRRVNHLLPAGVWLAISAAVFFLCGVFSPSSGFLMAWNEYYGTFIPPLFYGLSGSIATVLLARSISGKWGAFFADLGRESFHIMANHLVVTFLLGLVLAVPLRDRSWFKDIYSLPKDSMAVFYFAAGLLIPWFAVSRLRSRFGKTAASLDRNIRISKELPQG